ncbi:MAG: branched-chain amino acid transaminase [Terriglobia bacterium]
MPIDKVEKIWFNGKLLPWAEAKIHLLSHALHYGTGVFEGIRAYATPNGVAVFRLTDHMKRFEKSASIYYMDLPFSVEDMVRAVKDVVRVNKLQSGYIRPIAFRGYGEMGLFPLKAPVDVGVAAWPWGTYLGEKGIEHGVRAKISSFRRNDPNVIPPAAKATGQYLNSILAKIEVSRAGYDEAILLNDRGQVADGSGENVFVVKNGRLITPPTSAGALDGITRDSIIRIAGDFGLRVSEEPLVRTDLFLADEAFFTGTAAEIVPIRDVDEHVIGEPGPITKKLQAKFFAVVKGEDTSYPDWVEAV